MSQGESSWLCLWPGLSLGHTGVGSSSLLGGPLWPHAPYPQRYISPEMSGSFSQEATVPRVGERTAGLLRWLDTPRCEQVGGSHMLRAECRAAAVSASCCPHLCLATVCWLGCCRPSHCYQVLQWKVQTPTSAIGRLCLRDSLGPGCGRGEKEQRGSWRWGETQHCDPSNPADPIGDQWGRGGREGFNYTLRTW